MARIITLGSLNLDFTYQLPKPLETGETLSSLSYRCGAGGKGANQSIAAARAGLSVFHAGLVGEDELSETYILPAAFDPRVAPAVAGAVAAAAKASGVAGV